MGSRLKRNIERRALQPAPLALPSFSLLLPKVAHPACQKFCRAVNALFELGAVDTQLTRGSKRLTGRISLQHPRRQPCLSN